MPDSIKNLFDLPYTELIWIEPSTTPFLFQNKIEINFENGFYAGKYPVTQLLYRSMTYNFNIFEAAHFEGVNHPMERVSWEDAQLAIRLLNTQTNKFYEDGLQFRLPTEVQWEYCASNFGWDVDEVAPRLGVPDDYSGSHILDEVGWYDKNSGGRTHPVGLKEPSLRGIYDMSGNVWEWCVDRYTKDVDLNYFEAIKDKNINRSEARVIRGGCWNNYDSYSQVLTRAKFFPNIKDYILGFRLFRY